MKLRKDKDGYLVCKVNGKAWRHHRLVWTEANGKIPKGMEIHHINGVRDDNRIENLALVTQSQNKEKSLGRGWNYAGSKTNPYRASRYINSVRTYLGVFGTKCGAYMAHRMAYINKGGQYE